jgi:hypothetical protein
MILKEISSRPIGSFCINFNVEETIAPDFGKENVKKKKVLQIEIGYSSKNTKTILNFILTKSDVFRELIQDILKKSSYVNRRNAEDNLFLEALVTSSHSLSLGRDLNHAFDLYGLKCLDNLDSQSLNTTHEFEKKKDFYDFLVYFSSIEDFFKFLNDIAYVVQGRESIRSIINPSLRKFIGDDSEIKEYLELPW